MLSVWHLPLEKVQAEKVIYIGYMVGPVGFNLKKVCIFIDGKFCKKIIGISFGTPQRPTL